MFPFYIACETISAVLFNLLWASSLTASCFSSFIVSILKDFCVIIIAREKTRLVPLNAVPTGRPTLLANGEIETPPLITVDSIRAVCTMLVILFNSFIFSSAVRKLQIHQANMHQFQLTFSNNMLMTFVERWCLDLDKSY